MEQGPLFTGIDIADTGPGLPPQDYPRVFGRFYRGKTARVPGTGLGRSIAREILRQQGGNITVESMGKSTLLHLGLDGRKGDRDRVRSLIESVGLGEKEKSLPSQLSGGQQQRVAIARALVTQPAVVLADEPTGSLDSKTGAEVLNLLRSTAARLGQTIVLITHDDKVAQLCDRILRIEDGRIVE